MSLLERVWNAWKGERRSTDSPSAERSFDVRKLEDALGYSLHNPKLFYQALIHRSYLQVLNDASTSNERLEYLGDSVLNLVVSEYVFHHYPDADEGDLTKMRARLVNRKALAAYAKHIRLWDFMLVSSSTAQSVGRGSETILADALEALIAALYLDGGYRRAQEFVRRQILRAVDEGTVSTEDENFKSRLLEISQASGFGVPRYSVLNEAGPDHDRTFTVEVRVGDRVSGAGTGKNKKDAEQAAAEHALENLASLRSA